MVTMSLYNQTYMEISAIIAESYLAQGFSPEFIDRLVGIASIAEFKAGEHIVHEDEENCDLMILGSGQAQIVTESGDLIGVLKSVVPFGEVAFLDRKRRSSNVVASTDCKVVILPETPLRDLMQAEPEMAVRALMNLSTLLCDRLRKANQQIAALNAIEEFSR
jgi:CRP-like cAMP-binding protein